MPRKNDYTQYNTAVLNVKIKIWLVILNKTCYKTKHFFAKRNK